MYKSHSKALPARVLQHKSKLRVFDYDVLYDAGITTSSDYGSRIPSTTKQYTAEEREELGVETEEDAEVVIARLDSMTDAVTMPILEKNTEKEYKRLLQDVQQENVSEATTKLTGIKECFANVLDVAHEGCLGGDSMLRQLMMDVWW